MNDTCGHAAGDELLRQIGNLLRNQIRTQVTFAELRFIWEKQRFQIGVSIGLVPITATSDSISKLLLAADGACYAAKDRGRNHVQVYELDNFDLAR